MSTPSTPRVTLEPRARPSRSSRLLGLSVRLSGLELLSCWEALNLGAPPLLLGLFSPARTHREHHQCCTEALRGLGARGLAEHGHPVPALAQALRLLAHSDHLLDLRRGDGPQRMLLGLGALAGADGLMVVSDGTPEGSFDLIGMDAARVAGGLLGLCHPITPGLGRPVNIPADLLDQAAARTHGDLWAMADHLQHAGIPRLDAVSLARMLSGIRVGGQLGVTTTGHRGPWRYQCPTSVAFSPMETSRLVRMTL